MGLAPCYRANVAYSLYGVLKGERDTGCNAKTYINSFFTTQGVETFTEYMQYAGTTFSAGNDDGYAGGVSSICTAEDNGAGYDDGYGYSHGDNIGTGYSSYAVGCSSGGQYAEKTFTGQYCTESASSIVTNELKDFNEDMSKIRCKSIYSSQQQGNYNNEGASPVEVLAVSRSCSVLEHPNTCPDPHGKLIKYERRLEDSTGYVHNQRKERVRKILSWMLLVIGLLLMMVSLLSHMNQKQAKAAKAVAKPEKKPNLWQRMTSIFRRKGRKANQNNNNNNNNSSNQGQ